MASKDPKQNERIKARQRKYIAMGLCRCGKERAPGRKSCERCLAVARKHSRKYIRRKNSQGLCSACGRVKAQKVCRDCRDKANKSRRGEAHLTLDAERIRRRLVDSGVMYGCRSPLVFHPPDAPVIDTEALYRKHRRRIEIVAKSACRHSGLPYEDFLSVGFEALMTVHRLHSDKPVDEFQFLLGARLSGAMKDLMRASDYFPRRYRHSNPDAAMASLDAASDEYGLEPADESLDVESALDDLAEARAFESAVTESLNTREQFIIRHIVQGLALHEIGQELGISEPRVSQLKTRALKKMREWLAMR